MKLISVVILALAAIANAQPKGIDVSGYQPNINWATVKANGVEFAFIKATEGTGRTYIVSPKFAC
jgi:GH25 family lysozyme M1 (1,4-beta-N-acetylmuramidase)